MKRTLKKIQTNARIYTKSIRKTRLILSLSELFWKILEVASGIQISVDVLLAENDLVKSRRAVYLMGALLLILFAVTFPDRIASILSYSQIDTVTLSERTHGFVRVIRKMLNLF